MDRLYTVTELATELGITPRTIRFYETKGLLSPKRAGTTRVYGHRDRARMQLILRGKRLGFSLADIKEYLDLYTADTSHVEQIHLLLKKVRDRLGGLEAQRREVEATIAELGEIESLASAALKEKAGGGEM